MEGSAPVRSPWKEIYWYKGAVKRDKNWLRAAKYEFTCPEFWTKILMLSVMQAKKIWKKIN